VDHKSVRPVYTKCNLSHLHEISVALRFAISLNLGSIYYRFSRKSQNSFN